MHSLHDYPLDLIVNADQTLLFLEMPAERTIKMKGARMVHVQSAGYEKERVTVMLAVTASGLKILSYVVFKRKTVSKVPIPTSKRTTEDHLTLAHMRDMSEVEVLDDGNELVVNPFYAEVPLPTEELQAAAQEDHAAKEDAEAAAAEEEGVVLEEGGEAEVS
ncbi:unnamed protein product [Closterium sp. NIES-53]